MRGECKPDKFDRLANPALWRRWKALRHIEQQIDNEIRELTLTGIDASGLDDINQKLNRVKLDLHQRMRR